MPPFGAKLTNLSSVWIIRSGLKIVGLRVVQWTFVWWIGEERSWIIIRPLWVWVLLRVRSLVVIGLGIVVRAVSGFRIVIGARRLVGRMRARARVRDKSSWVLRGEKRRIEWTRLCIEKIFVSKKKFAMVSEFNRLYSSSNGYHKGVELNPSPLRIQRQRLASVTGSPTMTNWSAILLIFSKKIVTRLASSCGCLKQSRSSMIFAEETTE